MQTSYAASGEFTVSEKLREKQRVCGKHKAKRLDTLKNNSFLNPPLINRQKTQSEVTSFRCLGVMIFFRYGPIRFFSQPIQVICSRGS